MRQVVRRSVLAALAAGGLVLAGAGNVVNVPIHVPVNVCAESVNIVGLLNPASGRTCSAD